MNYTILILTLLLQAWAMPLVFAESFASKEVLVQELPVSPPSLAELGFLPTKSGFIHGESYEFFTTEQGARDYALTVAEMQENAEWSEHLKDVRDANKEDLLATEEINLAAGKKLLVENDFSEDLDAQALKTYQATQRPMWGVPAAQFVENYNPIEKQSEQVGMTAKEKAEHELAVNYFQENKNIKQQELLYKVIALKKKLHLTAPERQELQNLAKQLSRDELVQALIYSRRKGSKNHPAKLKLEKEMADFAVLIIGTEEQRKQIKAPNPDKKPYTKRSKKLTSPSLRKGQKEKKKQAQQNLAVIPYLKRLYLQADANNYWNTEEKNKFYVSFYQKRFVEILVKATKIKEKYLNLMQDPKILGIDKFNLALIYTATVYKTVRGMLRLFDREPDLKVKQMKSDYLEQLLPEINKDLIDEKIIKKLADNNLEMIDHPDKPNIYQIKLSAMGNLTEDIIFHLYIPSSHYYLQATKLITLKTMLEKIENYNALIGDKNYLKTPVACQASDGAKLPAQIATSFPSLEARKEALTNLLINNGFSQPELYRDETTELEIETPQQIAYNNYYLNNIQIDIKSQDPYGAGFNPLFPFEQYLNAKTALKILQDKSAFSNGYGRFFSTNEEYQKVLLDDSSQFNMVLEAKLLAVAKILKEKEPKKSKRISGRNKSHHRMKEFNAVKETFKDIMTVNETPCLMHMQSEKLYCFEEVEEIKKNKKHWEDRYEEIFETKGISKYLLKKIQAAGKDHPERFEWWQHINPLVLAKLEKLNVRFDMPSLYSNDMWRRWGLQTMYHYLLKNRSTGHLKHIFRNLCNGSGAWNGELCKGFPSNDINNKFTMGLLNKLILKLRPFTDNGRYGINLAHVDYQKIAPYMPFMRGLWRNAQCGLSPFCQRQTKLLFPQTWVPEKDFILAQVGHNHWAALRVSYLDALQVMRAQKNSFVSVFERLGEELKLHKTLRPFHGNRVLSHTETQELYKKIIKDMDVKNNFVLQSKTPDGKSYYQHMKDVFSFNFFTPDAVKKAQKKFAFLNTGVTNDEFAQDKSAAEKHPSHKFINDMHKITAARGQPETQKKYFQDFFNQHTLTAGDFKSAFLTMENRYKAPLYRQLIRKSANIRRQKLASNMAEICRLRQDVSTKDYNNLFYLTAEAQLLLANNKQMKIAVPEKVRDRVDGMTDEDWGVLWISLGAGLAYAAASIASGGTILLLTMATALAATVTQTIAPIAEYRQAKESRKSADLVRRFAADGLTDAAGAAEVTRSYGWAVMEAAFALPFVGLLGRSIQATTRTFSTQKVLTKRILQEQFKFSGHLPPSKQEIKQAKKLAKKLARETALMEGDALYAKYLIQLETLQLMPAGHNPAFIKTLIQNIRGKLSQELFQKIIVAEGKQQIDRGFNKTFVRWFKGDPKQAYKFFKGYSQQQGIFKRAMQKVTMAREGSFVHNMFDGRMQKAQRALLKHEATLANDQAGWGIKKFAAWRLKKLNQYVDASHDLDIVLANLKTLTSSAEFYKYTIKNSALMSNIIEVLPFKLSQIPHFILALGTPSVAKPIPIWGQLRYVPGLGGWSDGVILKRMVAAKNLLLKESVAEEQRRLLIQAGAQGISPGVNAHSSFAAYHGYRQAVIMASAKLVGQAAKNLTESSERLHYDVAKLVYDNYLARMRQANPAQREGHLTYSEFAAMLDQENPLAIAIFNNTDKNLIFGQNNHMDVFQETFHTLEDYRNFGEMQLFWNMGKILAMQERGDLFQRLQ